jgi:hypothetical protein
MARAQAQAALIVGVKPSQAEVAAIDPRRIHHLEAYRPSAVEGQAAARYLSCPSCSCIAKDFYGQVIEEGPGYYYCPCCGSPFKA